MQLSTTPYIDGKQIRDNKGLVFAQSVRGFAAGQGFFDSFRAMGGKRSVGHEELIDQVRQEALGELQQAARAVGANAIVGITIDVDPVSLREAPMVLAKASGTAVVI